MTSIKKDKDTERFYNLSYIIIPLPMIAGAFFAAYVLITEDSRNDSFCATAIHIDAYQQKPLQEQNFLSLEKVTLDICKDRDNNIDNGDGRMVGKVRWYVCKGTICGPNWENILNQ